MKFFFQNVALQFIKQKVAFFLDIAMQFDKEGKMAFSTWEFFISLKLFF